MTTFLLDIWHDLREKRLWPVAVGLLVATVAIPVVLAKPAEAPKVDTAPPSATTAALPTVAHDESIVDSSHLDAFDIKNPFNSLADGEKPNLGDQAGSGTPGGSSSGGSDVIGGSDATGGGSMAGGSGGGGGGAGGSGGGGGTKYYTYTVDVKFGTRKPRDYKGLRTLDLLPDDQNPIVSFMGMTDNAKTAVFFVVDPAFEADGEGTCNPSPDDCRFIYLGLEDDRDEETLSAAEGQVEYTLQLTKINIKHLTEAEAVGDAQPEANPDTPTAAKRSQRRKQKDLMTVSLVAARR
jgi:hypothetical protein